MSATKLEQPMRAMKLLDINVLQYSFNQRGFIQMFLNQKQ